MPTIHKVLFSPRLSESQHAPWRRTCSRPWGFWCVSNFSSPRLSLPPLGRALGGTAGLMRSRRPASGWIATSHNESQGARSPRQMCSRGGAVWARLGAFPTFLLLACPCLRWVARWAGPLGSCGRVGLRPDGLQRVRASHKVPDPRGKCTHEGARAGRAWVRFQLLFSSPVLASLGRALGRTAGLMRSRRSASGSIATSHKVSDPRGKCAHEGGGLGAPGCVSNFSSPRTPSLNRTVRFLR